MRAMYQPNDPYDAPKCALFAHLANIESLAALTEEDKRALLTELQQAWFVCVRGVSTVFRLVSRKGTLHWVDQLDGQIRFAADPQVQAAWGIRTPVPFAWEVLLRVHPWARTLITTLVDGKEVALRPLGQFEGTILQFHESTGTVQEQFEGSLLRNEPIVALGQVLRRTTPSFRRCPYCRTVFVPGKNQKFCSSVCTAKGTEAARKDERRGYMRLYMAARRQQAKEQSGHKTEAARTAAGTNRGTRPVKRGKR